MYTLRRISGDGLEINQSIGNSYTVIQAISNPNEFSKAFETYFDKEWNIQEDNDSKKCYAFIAFEDGTLQPLYKGQRNYIMTIQGTTFSNLTFR